MKQTILYTVITAIFFLSCSSDDDPTTGYNLTGLWYGQRIYDNPAGGTKTQYLYVRLNENGTGELDYEGPVSFAKAYFNYSVSDTKVICKGVYADTYGEAERDFYLTLVISGTSLIPQERYNEFVLTRDNNAPIVPGNKQEDYSSILKNIWIEDNGKTILNINSQNTELYIVNNNNQYTYYSESGGFNYDQEKQTLSFDATQWFIKECNSDRLILNNSGISHSYTVGRSKDIPKQPCFHEYLPLVSPLHSADINQKYTLIFEKDYKISYYERSTTYVMSPYSSTPVLAELIATGTWEYTSRENEIVCYFQSPTWVGGSEDKYKNLFPGWEYGKTCIKYLTINAISPKQFNVTLPNGSTYLMK